MNPIDERVHRCIQTELKYKKYSIRLKKEMERMKKEQMYGDISDLDYLSHKNNFTG